MAAARGPGPDDGWRPWHEAWEQALYGPRGFYALAAPGDHFRTASHASASGLLGTAVARLARAAGCTRVVDVGAGAGELLRGIGAADPGLALLGVEVRARPADLPDAVGWAPAAPGRMESTLLVGWELLDVVPCPVLQVAPSGGLRVVEVDRGGRERPGAPASAEDLDWCVQWWPAGRPGDRVEVGRTRDAVWSALVDRLVDGLALAVDYGHDAGARPPAGSLTGYRLGRQVRPVPDGTCDLTAHVATDAVAAAAPGGVRLPQHEALAHLGLRSERPDPGTARTDPMGWLTALARSGEAAELLDPAGLGGFDWVLHPRGGRAGSALAGWTPPARP